MKVVGPMFSVDARGGMWGTVVFSIWRSINYIRAFAMPTNPQSPRQILIRSLLTTAARAWGLLTDIQRENWDDAGAQMGKKTQLGQDYTLTGVAYYVGLSVLAQDLGETPVTDPPAASDPPIVPDAAVVTGLLLSGDIDCSWTAGAGDFVDIWITRALSDGEKPQKNLFRHLSYTADATAVLVISGLLSDRKYGVKMRSVLNSGQDGPYQAFTVRSKA